MSFLSAFSSNIYKSCPNQSLLLRQVLSLNMLRIRDQSMTFAYIYIQEQKFHVWSSITSYRCHSSEEDEISNQSWKPLCWNLLTWQDSKLPHQFWNHIIRKKLQIEQLYSRENCCSNLSPKYWLILCTLPEQKSKTWWEFPSFQW